MSTRTLLGKNYSYQNGIIGFYKAKGNNSKTSTWLINWDGLGGYQDDPQIEFSPTRAKTTLHEIKSIIDTGENLVLIRPEIAVILFLEGTIKPEQLSKANENYRFIEIQDVAFGKKKIKIRIIDGFTYNIASEDWNIVY